MRDGWFGGLRVGSVQAGDRARFDAELDEHHWLGHRMVGETMRYVATDANGVWVALVGFGSSALSCRPRDCFVGWSPEVQFRRLRYVASNQRFCVLAAGRRQNAASAVMARTLRRLRADWVRGWGHPVLLVETFVDPARHVGTCYGASSFQLVGQSAGYGRRSGRYVAHGRVKDVYVKALHRRATQVLAGEFDHPLLLADPGSSVARIDFNTADLSSLVDRLDQLTDPRDARGLRHRFAATLTLVACATLAGHKTMVAISEWCDAASQQALARLDARVSPGTGLRIPPSYATIRRALMAVDPDEFDLIVNAWAAEQAARRGPLTGGHRHGPDADADPGGDRDGDLGGDGDGSGNRNVGGDLVGVAVDAKTLRGAKRADGTQVQLLAALRHDVGMVIGQANVENDKTNEIRSFGPLLEPLRLTAMVVTADAMHTQRNAAKAVAAKGAHYIFGVKGNQPKLWNAGIDALDEIDLDRPAYETSQRGHGRIDRHRIWTAPIPATVTFPNASRYIIIERESSTLADVRTSIEHRIYITDLTDDQASAEHCSASDFAAEGPPRNDPSLGVSSILLRGAVYARAEWPEVAEEVVGGDEVGGVLVGDHRRDHSGRTEANCGHRPDQVLADAGYFSEPNVAAANNRDVDALIATGRLKHHETPPPAPRGPIPKAATPKARMARKLRTKPGRAAYARRKAIIEPVFGQIDTVQGGKQVLLRGQAAAAAEWALLAQATTSANSSTTPGHPTQPPGETQVKRQPTRSSVPTRGRPTPTPNPNARHTHDHTPFVVTDTRS